MTRVRGFPGLRAWIIVSILLHVGLILLPAQFFDVFYPREAYVPDEHTFRPLADFIPDYRLVDLAPETETPTAPEEPVLIEIEEYHTPVETPAQASPQPAGEASDEAARGGTHLGLGIAEPEDQFFPPVPRYIVPPDLEDLGVTSIRLDLRIFVSTTGEPLEIVLPDTLANEAIRYRVVESARRFRFQPARRGDRPVASWIDLPLVLESAESD
jgi:hypothetical protein